MPRRALWFLTWVLRWVEFQGNLTPKGGFPVAPPNISTPPYDHGHSRAGGQQRCYRLGSQLRKVPWIILVRTDTEGIRSRNHSISCQQQGTVLRSFSLSFCLTVFKLIFLKSAIKDNTEVMWKLSLASPLHLPSPRPLSLQFIWQRGVAQSLIQHCYPSVPEHD